MNGHPRLLNPVLPSLVLSVDAGKRRQERRMDIQNGIGIFADEFRTQHPHESSKADQPDVASLQLTEDFLIVKFTGGKPASSGVVNYEGFDAGFPCAKNSFRARSI